MDMLAIMRSEVTKFLTLPGVWVLTLVQLVILLFLQSTLLSDNIEMIANVGPDGMVEFWGETVNVKSEVTQSIGTGIFNATLLLPILGAVIAGAEFRGGQLGMSVVAVPNRLRLIMGKAAATTLFAIGFGILCITIGTVSTYIGVKEWNPGLLWSPAMLASHGRSLLFMITITVIGLSITLITRRTLIGIITSVTLMMLTLAQVIAAITPTVDAFLPFSAARNLLLQGGDAGAPLTGSAGHGAIVLAAWAAITTTIAVIAIQRKDAR